MIEMRPETLFAPPRGEAAREHAPRQAAWATRAADGAPGTHGDPDAQLELAAAKSEEGWEAIAAKPGGSSGGDGDRQVSPSARADAPR